MRSTRNEKRMRVQDKKKTRENEENTTKYLFSDARCDFFHQFLFIFVNAQ